jgi:hypothetical protein
MLAIGLLILCFAVAIALSYLTSWPAPLGALACYPLCMGYMGYSIRVRGKVPKLGDLDLTVEQHTAPPLGQSTGEAPAPSHDSPRTMPPARRRRSVSTDVFQMQFPE